MRLSRPSSRSTSPCRRRSTLWTRDNMDAFAWTRALAASQVTADDGGKTTMSFCVSIRNAMMMLRPVCCFRGAICCGFFRVPISLSCASLMNDDASCRELGPRRISYE
jgi:hypothetical protein